MTPMHDNFARMLTLFEGGQRSFGMECISSRQAWRIKSHFYKWRKTFPPEHLVWRVMVGVQKTPAVVIEFSIGVDAEHFSRALSAGQSVPPTDAEATLNTFLEEAANALKDT